MVLRVLADHPIKGLSTHDLIKAGYEQFPNALQPVPAVHVVPPQDRPKLPPGARKPPAHTYMEHPFRSMSYVKRILLAGMLEANEVEKVHIIRGGVRPEDGERLPDRVISKKRGLMEVDPYLKVKETWNWRSMPGALEMLDDKSRPGHNRNTPDTAQ